MERNPRQNPAPVGGNLVQPASRTVVELRGRRGWTQEKLAEKSILSVRTIQNLEQGRSIHLGTIARVAEALGVPAAECIASTVEFRAIQDSATANADSLAPCPYRGLLAFREEDADVFFGRELQIEILKEKLAHRNIVQVSGYSGSGKSSLVAAGLIPSLKQSESWQVLYCRPGSDPFGTLASALIPQLEPASDEIARAAQIPRLIEVLEQGQLHYLLAQILRSSKKTRLLLFIDQFEEIYTQCNAQRVRDRFLDALVPIASGGFDVKLVYTIRADISSRLLSHRRFLDELQDGDVKIGPMNREEMELAIRAPALRHHVKFEDGLVDRIISDAGAEPGNLPLLEFTLTELWGRQSERTLSHSAYERIGQLSGAIAHRAEKVFRSLTLLQQHAAHHILARLVRLGDEGGEDTRQRIPESALFSEELLNGDAGRRVLDVLTDARLVVVGIESGGRQRMVEIAHEALVRRWPRLNQWLQEDREILIWRQRIRLIIRQWDLTGRDDGFLLRGVLLDEAKLWLARRANDLSPAEKDFVSASLDLWHRERSQRPVARLELLVDNPGSLDLGGTSGYTSTMSDHRNFRKDLSFLDRPGALRLEINITSIAEGHGQSLHSRLPVVPVSVLGPILSTAVPTKVPDDSEDNLHETVISSQKLDDQTFALLRDLQLRGASGLALELLSPQLDGILEPDIRLKFASIAFDMMHVRGRYADAAELIRQELAVHSQNADVHSRLLLPLRIRLVHHQMFYRPVAELWAQMNDLLENSDCAQDAESYGEILFMLGGNLGTLSGDYQVARKFLVRAMRHAKCRRDCYLLTRCLRKYGDFLRYEGHLRLSKLALTEALRLSARGRGTRQRIYILGCLGDLERQQRNYSQAAENFERAIELARSTFIPGWLGNLNVGLAEVALERYSFGEAKIFLEQAEAHYKCTQPQHLWGGIQVGLARARLMRAAGEPSWMEQARLVGRDALAAGYTKDSEFAALLLRGETSPRNSLMFL